MFVYRRVYNPFTKYHGHPSSEHKEKIEAKGVVELTFGKVEMMAGAACRLKDN